MIPSVQSKYGSIQDDGAVQDFILEPGRHSKWIESEHVKDQSPTFSIDDNVFAVSQLQPGLYIVSTPIGNLGDVTIRALQTLAAVNVIACEDTRITKRLLERYGISSRLLPYHDRNGPTQRPKLVARLTAGETVALVSDAGTPLVSDPGYKLVEAARENEIPVFSVPGPSSLLAGLVVSGLPTDRFFFEGFLPVKEKARMSRLAALRDMSATLVFFESAKRLVKTLRAISKVFDDRHIVVARELTKKFEETVSGPIEDVLAQIEAREAVKGEIVLLIGPPENAGASTGDLDDLLGEALQRSSLKEAVAQVAGLTGIARREVYSRALQLAKRSAGNAG